MYKLDETRFNNMHINMNKEYKRAIFFFFSSDSRMLTRKYSFHDFCRVERAPSSPKEEILRAVKDVAKKSSGAGAAQ